MEEPLDYWEFEPQERERLQFYKDFVSVDDAREFAKLLYANDIPYSAEVPEPIIDQVFVGPGMLPKAIVRLFPEDFKKVNALLIEQLTGADSKQLKDHYLNQMENEELLKIIDKPDEWSLEDGIVAKIILRDRGIDISDSEIQNSRDRRFREIRKGRGGSTLWMSFYFLCIVSGALLSFILSMLLSVLFFLAGIGMGYHYAYSKTVDPDGQKYYEFNRSTRTYGKLILYGGLLTAFIGIVLLFRN